MFHTAKKVVAKVYSSANHGSYQVHVFCGFIIIKNNVTIIAIDLHHITASAISYMVGLFSLRFINNRQPIRSRLIKSPNDNRVEQN